MVGKRVVLVWLGGVLNVMGWLGLVDGWFGWRWGGYVW